ncbi:PadR family transcriptional regulator [candidate division KSB1 bacterium]
MEILSKQEELILLAVWRLQDDAYGIKIRDYLNDVTGQKMSIGGIYVPLDRLVRKGYLDTYQGKPTPERGGMSKRFFSVTKSGAAALEQTKSVRDALWEDLPNLKFKKS